MSTDRTSPHAFFASAALHAGLMALVLWFTWAHNRSSEKDAPQIFELVAGEGDNFAATEAPALGVAGGGIKLEIPGPPTPEPSPVVEAAPPEPEPSPVVAAAAPIEEAPPPPPKPKPVEKAKPDVQVKEHAVRTEKEGRPAHDIGDRTLAEPKDPDAR